MAPLTPARRPEGRLVRAGLSASCAWPSDHSASNHHLGPPIALTRYPSAWEAAGSHRFGLRPLPAGSPHEQAESSSLALRTGRSPPVASHPASRRRSFLRLQAGERLPGEDLHLSDLAHSQTHWPGQLVVPVAKRQEARARSSLDRFARPICSPGGRSRSWPDMHQNPVRAGLVEKPEDWPWSSAGYHATGRSVGVPVAWLG